MSFVGLHDHVSSRTISASAVASTSTGTGTHNNGGNNGGNDGGNNKSTTYHSHNHSHNHKHNSNQSLDVQRFLYFVFQQEQQRKRTDHIVSLFRHRDFNHCESDEDSDYSYASHSLISDLDLESSESESDDLRITHHESKTDDDMAPHRLEFEQPPQATPACSSSTVASPRRRSVEFSSNNVVYPIDHFRDYSPVEQSSTWMSRQELYAVRRACIVKVQQLDLIHADDETAASQAAPHAPQESGEQMEEEKKEGSDSSPDDIPVDAGDNDGGNSADHVTANTDNDDDDDCGVDKSLRDSISKMLMLENANVSHDDIRGLESYTQFNLQRSKTARAMAKEAVFGMQKFQKFKGTNMPELMAEVYANSCTDSLKQAQGMAQLDAEHARR